MESLISSFLKPIPFPATSSLYGKRVSPVLTHSFTFATMAAPATPKRSSVLTGTPSPTTTTMTTVLENEESSHTNDSITPKKVLVPIGFGIEEMEAVIIIAVLRQAGAQVTVASIEPQLQVEATSGTRLVADTSITTCTDQTFDLVVLPGGMPGSARLRDCDILQTIMKKQAEEKRLYGAISTAPAITLLPWGLLRRKKMTGHPAFFDKLPSFWAVKSNILVSGELTTSRGPGTCFVFALTLVEQLFGESIAKDVGTFMLMSPSDDKPKTEEFNKVEWSLDHTPRVLIPVANGSEEIEVVTIVDILRRAKVDVTVASVERSTRIFASQGTKVAADKYLSDAAESIYDLIILPGGIAGVERLGKSRILKKMLKEQDTAGRVYGAVSSSSTVLHKYGFLEEKKTTAQPAVIDEPTYEVVDGASVVIDGKLITSLGRATVSDFAFAIVSKLFGHARARSVADGLVFEHLRS